VESCTITDIPDLLPHIRHNVARNAPLFKPCMPYVQVGSGVEVSSYSRPLNDCTYRGTNTHTHT